MLLYQRQSYRRSRDRRSLADMACSWDSHDRTGTGVTSVHQRLTYAAGLPPLSPPLPVGSVSRDPPPPPPPPTAPPRGGAVTLLCDSLWGGDSHGQSYRLGFLVVVCASLVSSQAREGVCSVVPCVLRVPSDFPDVYFTVSQVSFQCR